MFTQQQAGHRARPPLTAHTAGPIASLGPPVRTARLLTVSNRLPITIRLERGEPMVTRSVGGLATGLRGPHEHSGGLWIGWTGMPAAADSPQAREIQRQMALLRVHPVDIPAEEAAIFYERISNGVLWPLFHDRLDRLPLKVAGWDMYESVNQRFADAVVDAYQPGDVIWVHDYQLLRLPHLLRQRLPDARIGFFLHVPFPGVDIFATLPVRRQLLEGLLGADLIGFHTQGYRAHFATALRRLADVEVTGDSAVRVGDRTVRLGVFPIGVDASEIVEGSGALAVSAQVLALRAPHERIVLGIDRLDYSKGIARRLIAYNQFLRRHPEWHGRVRLIQLAVPSRGAVRAYRHFRREIEALVGRINGRYATPTWTPIQYLHRSVDDTMLHALYRSADVMLVTPLRDGMNLVAKEFVAARNDEGGVLVLSEFAGAADELTEAVLVNPYDVDAVGEAIHQGLTMEASERRRRMARLRGHVLEYTVQHWAESFLSALGTPTAAATAHA